MQALNGLLANVSIVIGKKLTISNANGQFANIPVIPNDLKPLTVFLIGSTDQGNVQFTLKATYK